MPTTTPTTVALVPRQVQQVTYLPRTDLTARPAGRHAAPAPDSDAYWDAEVDARWSPPRPTAQHGRRCGCCRALLGHAQVAS